MYKDIEAVIKLLEEEKWDDALAIFENIRPWQIDEALGEFVHRTNYDDLSDLMSEDQWYRLKRLCCSERRCEYYMNIPDEEMSDEDWADLRASDF